MCPADGVETPVAQATGDALLQPPFFCAVARAPDVDVVRVFERARLDVVHAKRKKDAALWIDEPPAAVDCFKAKKTGGLATNVPAATVLAQTQTH